MTYQELQKEVKKLKKENTEIKNKLEEWEELSNLFHNKYVLVEQINQLKKRIDSLIIVKDTIPVGELNIGSRVKYFFDKNKIQFVNMDSCLIKQDYESFYGFGKAKHDEIKNAIIEYKSSVES